MQKNFLLSMLFICCTIPVSVQASLPIQDLSRNISINGEDLLVHPYISDKGDILIPLRTVLERLGCNVSWDADTRTATVNQFNTRLKTTIKVTEGKNLIDDINHYDGIEVASSWYKTPPTIINNTLYVPIDFLWHFSNFDSAVSIEQPKEININTNLYIKTAFIIDGEKFDDYSYIDKNVRFVPVRVVAEKLGYPIVWDNQQKSATLKSDFVQLTIQDGREIAFVSKIDENGNVEKPQRVALSGKILLNGWTLYAPIEIFEILKNNDTDAVRIVENNIIIKN